MKFAIATSDGYQCVLTAFLKAGWELEQVFVSPGDRINDTKQVAARARELGAGVKSSPVSTGDLREIAQRGCELLVVASYQWKIPKWEDDLGYAINFHPSPLPEARGPYPYVKAIMEGRNEWAVTCHKVSDRFDQGDILDSERFPLDADETRESLFLKTQMAAARLAVRAARDLAGLWKSAVPQGDGTYWARWSERDRLIDFSQTVDAVMRQIRAFGDIECIASINGTAVFVHRAKGWKQVHPAKPGEVVHASNLSMVVAAADGLIAITEWSLTAPDLTSRAA